MFRSVVALVTVTGVVRKAPVYLERATKKSFCTECHPLRAEYYTHEYNEMWEIARMALFYWEDGFR